MLDETARAIAIAQNPGTAVAQVVLADAPVPGGEGPIRW